MNNIDHPKHYQKGVFETIEIIKIVLDELPDKQPSIHFCLGNAIKYLFRAGHKNDFLEDIKKAIWYLQEIVSIMELNNDKK